MDFTAEYGLKTRQVASWIWKRRGVLLGIAPVWIFSDLLPFQSFAIASNVASLGGQVFSSLSRRAYNKSDSFDKILKTHRMCLQQIFSARFSL